MDNSDAMRFFQDIADLRGNPDSMRRGETAFSRQRFRKRFALDKLHDDEVTSIWQIASVEDHGRMRMPQLRHRSRLAQETISNVAVAGKLRLDDFHRDRTLESQ